MAVAKELLEILACPKCKNSIKEKGSFLICEKCELAFPVFEDIPDLLLEDAWPLERAKKNKFMHDLKL